MMGAEMESATPANESEPLAPLRHYPGLPEASEHALVVLAMNEACWVVPQAGGFLLCVEPGRAAPIAAELAAYDAEQAQPRKEAEVPWVDASLLPALLWSALLLAVFSLQLQQPILADLGANSSVGLFARGEWWRPFTALFLHADFHHLLGNLAGGCAFFSLAARSLGTWRGWGLAMLSGVLGNLLTAWFHHPAPFRSLGASTAVFGALGLLTGLGLRFARHRHHGLRPLAAPLGGGLMLLAWLGTGGQQVDLLGHLLGFASGLALGLLSPAASAGPAPPRPGKPATAAQDPGLQEPERSS